MELYIFLMIAGVFYLTTLARPKAIKNYCAICIAISLSWIILLATTWLSLIRNDILLALLMGQSVVGAYYLAEHNVRERYLIFRLPFLLTLTLLAYGIIEQRLMTGIALLVAGLWAIHYAVYYFRNSPGLKASAKKLIDCCSRW